MDPKFLSDKVLNLSKIMTLNESDKKLVIDMFHLLIDCYSGKRGMHSLAGIPGNYDLMTADIIYRTLVENDYLITIREKRLDDLLDSSI